MTFHVMETKKEIVIRINALLNCRVGMVVWRGRDPVEQIVVMDGRNSRLICFTNSIVNLNSSCSVEKES